MAFLVCVTSPAVTQDNRGLGSGGRFTSRGPYRDYFRFPGSDPRKARKQAKKLVAEISQEFRQNSRANNRSKFRVEVFKKI